MLARHERAGLVRRLGTSPRWGEMYTSMTPTDSDVEVVAAALSLTDPDSRGLPPGELMAPFYRKLARAAIAADPGRKRMHEALRKIALAIPVEMAGASAMMCGTAKAALLWLGMDATSRTICDRVPGHD